MSGTFSQVTKIAVESLLEKHLTKSKYGFFLPEEGKQALMSDIVDFVTMSRVLKERGDRMLAKKGASATRRSPPMDP